eukprot:796163-Pelagomonas_calceolata.AAC.1
MVFIATWHVPCSPKGHMVHKAEPQSMQAAQEQDALLLSRVWLGCVCARVHVHMHACGMVLLLIRALSAACIGLNACMGALRNSFLAMQPCTTAPLHPCPASVWLSISSSSNRSSASADTTVVADASVVLRPLPLGPGSGANSHPRTGSTGRPMKWDRQEGCSCCLRDSQCHSAATHSLCV